MRAAAEPRRRIGALTGRWIVKGHDPDGVGVPGVTPDVFSSHSIALRSRRTVACDPPTAVCRAPSGDNSCKGPCHTSWAIDLSSFTLVVQPRQDSLRLLLSARTIATLDVAPNTSARSARSLGSFIADWRRAAASSVGH